MSARVRLPWTTRAALAGMLAVALLVAATTPALGQRHAVTFPAGVDALVSLQQTHPVAPTHLLGVSLEMSGLCTFLATYAQYPTQLVNLFRGIGPAIFKVGGKSSDYATWDPTGTASCGMKSTVVTEAEVDSVFAFAKAANAQVLWGLPLIHYNPAAAADQGAYVASVGKGRLLGFSIGNEPDLYVGAGMRPSNWTPADFVKEWKATRTAVVARVPRGRFFGPEFCCYSSFYTAFATKARRSAEAFSYHAYGASWKGLNPSTLLTAHTALTFANRASGFLKTAKSNRNLPVWLTETNSLAAGGAPGISDTYISSLWLADELFRGFREGLAQMDVQEVSGFSVYDPISPLAEARPDFYGALFFRLAAPAGSSSIKTQVTVQSPSTNITSYGVRLKSGGLNVVVFNKTDLPVTVQIKSDRTYASAGSFDMAAPSLDSQAVTIGGSAVDGTGALPAPSSTPVILLKKTATVTVPADTATCVQFLR